MKRLGAIAAIALIFAASALPAYAAQFVQDGASMFSQATVDALDQKIGAFNAQTGKEIVVVTVPSLNGETVAQAAQTVFSEQKINGVLIFISKGDRRDIVVPGAATAQFFPIATNVNIRQTMESQFKAGNYDDGITSAVNSILDIFRAHLSSAPGATRPNYSYPAAANGNVAARSSNGAHLSMFWWIVLIVVGFLVIRSIMRAAAGPRAYGPGPGTPGAPGAPGYGPGGPGYGGGYYGGGGGSFWSGLLGGLGGAWLGNEMFNRGGNSIVEQPGGAMMPGGDAGGSWSAPDAGGWGNDAGQADMGASSAGDFSGGGFGDSGGFGGGDFGGGGDSGGGW